MTPPDPRLAALRAVKQFYPVMDYSIDPEHGFAVMSEMEGGGWVMADRYLEVLDALAVAEVDQHSLRIDHGAEKSRADSLKSERDALAARLKGAERVVEAAGHYLDCNMELQDFAAVVINNTDYRASEAGGEGRGTV